MVKANPSQDFLSDFSEETFHLMKNGFEVRGVMYTIKIENFICDAPARSFIKCTNLHAGYSSCAKCTEGGEYIDGRVVYRGINAPKRTDYSFIKQLDEEHHIDTSPLTVLPIS